LVLPLTEFYRHPKTADGHLGKCKGCARKDVADYAERNPELIRAKKASYSKTDAGKRTSSASWLRHKAKFPERINATVAVNNAIKLGRLARQPCFVCGDVAQAHHPDYSRPLDVTWLCRKHHRETHQLAKQLNQPTQEGTKK